MPDSKKNSVQIFTGVMDKDTSDFFIGEGNYRDAVGIRNGYGARPGGFIIDRGNTEVEYTLPAGTNECVGAYEDKFCQTIIYMVWNSNSDHLILRYYPDKVSVDDPYGVIEKIAEGAALEFTGELITQIRLVDNQFLCWTDARSTKLSISGVEPKVLDIQKSDQNGKLFTYEAYHSSSDFTSTYTFTVFDNEGNQQVTKDFIITPTPTSLEELFDELADNISSPTVDTFLDVKSCMGCKLVIEMKIAEYYCTLTANNDDVILVPTNHYLTLDPVHVNLAILPPAYEPIVEYRLDSSFIYNFVQNDMFQFRTRYYYRDKTISSWGPISNIPLALTASGEIESSLNYIYVLLNDDRLDTVAFLSAVERVEVAFRTSNENPFKSAEIIDVCNLDFKTNAFSFYNDGLYDSIASDESGGDSQTQVLKLFDSAPRLCAAMELVSDEDGNTRLALGATLENYNVEPCEEIDLTLEYPAETSNCDLITISGRIDVLRQAFQTGSFDPQSWMWPDDGNQFNRERTVLNGFVVYLVGTPYYGISDNFLDNPTGEFQINNVPPGKYIMRVASYKCRFDNSAGVRYNINNGLDWQRTSSPMVDCAGSFALNGITFERELDLTAVTGTFNLLSEVGYGPIIIQDLRLTDGFTLVTEGYLLDSGGSGGAVAVKSGKGVELQRALFEMKYVAASSTNFVSVDRTTDCNGYFFVILHATPGGGEPILTTAIETIQAFTYDSENTEVGNEKGYSKSSGEIEAYSGATFDGKDVFYAIDNDVAIIGNPATVYTVWAAHLQTTNFSDHNKTFVEGTVLNAAGDPVSGVAVGITRCGQQTLTDSSGNYSIPIHVAHAPSENNRRADTIYFSYPADLCTDYPLNPNDISFDIGVFSADYNPTSKLLDQDSVVTLLTGPLITQFKTPKRGGLYGVGLVYEDDPGRKSTVTSKAEIRIPFHTEDSRYGPYYIQWSINSIPPIWATKFRVVRTQDATYNRYLQWVVSSVRYVTIDDADATPANSTLNDGTHVLLKIDPEFVSPAGSNIVNFFYRENEYVGFQPQAGDRVRLVLNDSFAVLSELYDFEIVGYYVESDIYYAVIKNEDKTIEIKDNFLVEFYTPKKADTGRIFYEQGETYPILNPHTANRLHGGQRQDQTASQPATGLLLGGDTYWRARNFVVGANIDGLLNTENQNLSDVFDSFNEDIGRPNVFDPNFGETFYYNRIRVSDVFVPNSQINGLSAFRSLEFQNINRDFGSIQYMEMLGQVLVVICEFKLQSIYVSKSDLIDLSGTTLVGRTDRLLNIANESVSDFGTQHPATVCVENGSIYSIDALKGIPWRFSQAGQQPINNNLVDEFNSIAKLVRNENNSVKMVAVFDRQFGEYILSYVIGAESASLRYDQLKGGWVGKHAFNPELYSRIGNILVSFNAGGLWVHDTNDTRMNYYGQQQTPSVRFIMNPDPTIVKDFLNLSILSKYFWTAPVISTPENNIYSSGQLSRLKQSHFSEYQGRFEADLLRDINDPKYLNITDQATRETTALKNGRVLKNNLIEITIQPVDPSLNHEVQSVSLEYTSSMDTKP